MQIDDIPRNRLYGDLASTAADRNQGTNSDRIACCDRNACGNRSADCHANLRTQPNGHTHRSASGAYPGRRG